MNDTVIEIKDDRDKYRSEQVRRQARLMRLRLAAQPLSDAEQIAAAARAFYIDRARSGFMRDDVDEFNRPIPTVLPFEIDTSKDTRKPSSHGDMTWAAWSDAKRASLLPLIAAAAAARAAAQRFTADRDYCHPDALDAYDDATQAAWVRVIAADRAVTDAQSDLAEAFRLGTTLDVVDHDEISRDRMHSGYHPGASRRI